MAVWSGDPGAGLALAQRPRRTSFDSIVVPLWPDGALSLRAVETGARIASKQATVHLASVLEVPRELPLDALFPEEEREARELLRSAAAVVETYGLHATERLERAHVPSLAIVELLGRVRPDVAVLAIQPRRRPRGSAIDSTIAPILRGAPCRVLLVAARPPA